MAFNWSRLFCIGFNKCITTHKVIFRKEIGVENKKWKEECDLCRTFQYDCQGYYEVNVLGELTGNYKIICPTCAKKLRAFEYNSDYPRAIMEDEL